MVACRAGGGADGSDDVDRPDIDALASYLSREAAKLRDASSSSAGGDSSGAADDARPLLVPHSDEIEGRLLEQVGRKGGQLLAGGPRPHPSCPSLSLANPSDLGTGPSGVECVWMEDGPAASVPTLPTHIPLRSGPAALIHRRWSWFSSWGRSACNR